MIGRPPGSPDGQGIEALATGHIARVAEGHGLRRIDGPGVAEGEGAGPKLRHILGIDLVAGQRGGPASAHAPIGTPHELLVVRGEVGVDQPDGVLLPRSPGAITIALHVVRYQCHVTTTELPDQRLDFWIVLSGDLAVVAPIADVALVGVQLETALAP